jgi:MEDS: MEthanogen/methylotroph, DcmR Sensory domain
MKATAAPIPFAGSMLGAYRHVCAFFSSPHEEYDILLPFVRDGLERGERAYHVFPARHLDEHLKQLRSAGIDVAGAQHRQQLEVTSVEETCLPGGHFNKDSMLALIPAALESGARLGFPLTRMIVHAETVLRERSRVNEWIEFEARLNDVLPSYDDPVICAYDANLLNGAIAVDILRTHPIAIIGGLLHENPFFVLPQEFFRKAPQHSGGPLKPYRG